MTNFLVASLVALPLVIIFLRLFLIHSCRCSNEETGCDRSSAVCFYRVVLCCLLLLAYYWFFSVLCGWPYMSWFFYLVSMCKLYCVAGFGDGLFWSCCGCSHFILWRFRMWYISGALVRLLIVLVFACDSVYIYWIMLVLCLGSGCVWYVWCSWCVVISCKYFCVFR